MDCKRTIIVQIVSHNDDLANRDYAYNWKPIQDKLVEMFGEDSPRYKNMLDTRTGHLIIDVRLYDIDLVTESASVYGFYEFMTQLVKQMWLTGLECDFTWKYEV